YKLSNAFLHSGRVDVSLGDMAQTVVDVFGVDGFAIFDRRKDTLVRAGPGASGISNTALRRAAASLSIENCTFAPVFQGAELAGSIGVLGAAWPNVLTEAVANQVGLGLAQLHAIREIHEAEVVCRSEELRAAVLDAMAHEFRNPLNSVKLAVTTLLSVQPSHEPAGAELLTIIAEEVDRMDMIIDDSVKLARLEAGLFSLSTSPQSLASLLPDVVAEMRPQAGRRPIRVSVPDALPRVDCDGQMIGRVVKQLIANAFKYSPEDSPLTVSAELGTEAIVIDVIDLGPGVDAEERDRIFEKYYRGRAAISGKPGTGLGLASARSIVRAHRGEIWVTSPPSGGAAFHVSLPVAVAANARAAAVGAS
ncbi:MAG TPA: ATP-binding protein, partial [Bryobacteraceae bacterium]